MKVVVAEPQVRRQHPNLGLLKIGAYHLRAGDDVVYARGNLKSVPFSPDRIYVSAIFTYYSQKAIGLIREATRRFPRADVKVGGVYPTLLPEHVFEHTGIRPHLGLLNKVETVPPAYSLVPVGDPFRDTSMLFTSRGCCRACKFCDVHNLEPKMSPVMNWKKHIHPKHRHIVIYDNNISAQSAAHRGKVFEHLGRLGKDVLFDNGFDCTLFDDAHADEVTSVHNTRVRFALDHIALIPQVEDAIRKVLNRGVGKTKIQVYVIYNFRDSVRETVKRCEFLLSLGVRPYPQVFRPSTMTSSKEQYLAPGWTLPEVRMIRYFYSLPTIYKAGSYWDWKRAGCPTLRGSKVNFSPKGEC